MKNYIFKPLEENVVEMFIGPFGSSLKNECFVDRDHAFCMVYEQKHAIQKTMNLVTRYVNKQKYNELKRFNIQAGDIIVSCRGTIGETFIIPEGAPLGIMHPSIMKIRLKEGVYDKYYFNLLLQERLKTFVSKANGSGIKMAISAKDLGKELFPIPPISEQIKISEIIAKVGNVIYLRIQQLEQLDLLIKSRFVEMFGDPVKNEKGWKTEKISEVAPINNYKGNFVDDKVWLLNLDMIEPNTGKIIDYVYVDKNEISNSTCSFDTSNVLYSKLRPYLNKVVIPDRIGFGTSELVPLQPITKLLIPIYFANLLRNNEFVYMISQKVARAKMPRVMMEEFRNFEVPLPPIELQNQFATFVEEVDKTKSTVKQSLEWLNTLKSKLMQDYFG